MSTLNSHPVRRPSQTSPIKPLRQPLRRRLRAAVSRFLRRLSDRVAVKVEHDWGQSWVILDTPKLRVERFSAKAGGESSTHYHDFTHHWLFVSRGRMEVYDAQAEESQVLSISQGLHVPVGVSHQLVFLEDTEGVEMLMSHPAALDVDPSDIHRTRPGKAG